MVRIGCIRGFVVARGHQVVAEYAPGLDVVWLHLDGSPQSLDRLVATTDAAQRESILEMCGSPVGLLTNKRIDKLQGRGRIARQPVGSGK